MKTIYFGKIDGNGSVISATFNKNTLTLCPSSGYLLNIFINDNLNLPEILPNK